MNFLALDFETANYYRDSACALGLARVENDKIVERASWCCKVILNFLQTAGTQDIAIKNRIMRHRKINLFKKWFY